MSIEKTEFLWQKSDFSRMGIFKFWFVGEAKGMRASGGKPFEKGLSENFQLG